VSSSGLRSIAFGATLVVAGVIASVDCQGEDAQGSRTSRSSGITVQVGNGVLDGSPSSEATSGQTTAPAAGERFSEENLRKADEFVAQQMKQQDLPSVVVGVAARPAERRGRGVGAG
jgi:hypothetical protein